MPWVREIIHSDGTKELSRLRVPPELAAAMDDGSSWLAEAWHEEHLQRRADALRAAAEAANRAVQSEFPPPDEPSAA